MTKQECRDILAPAVQKSLRWRDNIRLYYELGSRFPGAGWDDLDLGFEHASRCERIAIVTDIAWVGLTVKAIRFLIPGAIRVFAPIEAAASARTDRRPPPGSRADRRVPSQRQRCAPRPRQARRLPSRPRVHAAEPQRQPEELNHGYAE